MRKHSLLIMAAVLLPLPVMAQSLRDQIGAVDAVMQKQQADEAAAQAKAEKRLQAKIAAQKAAQARARKRNEAYADKLRDMKLEDMSLDLETKRAHVKRVNEYIDQDLKSQAAATDVVQSEADAIRHVSSGIGENLKSHGRAAEIKAKK